MNRDAIFELVFEKIAKFARLTDSGEASSLFIAHNVINILIDPFLVRSAAGAAAFARPKPGTNARSDSATRTADKGTHAAPRHTSRNSTDHAGPRHRRRAVLSFRLDRRLVRLRREHRILRQWHDRPPRVVRL